MKIHRLVSLAGALLLASSASAASLPFNGTAQAANITTIDWVLHPVAGQTKMWGTVETIAFTPSSQIGFTSLASIDLALLAFSFGDLELTAQQSPGVGTPGFEYYSEGDASVQPFEVRYNGALWATGTSVFLRTEVDNLTDIDAIGTGQAFLTGAGVDSAFFNEVMAQTGNTGLLNLSITNFAAVDNLGNFTSAGVMTTAIPEPSTAATLAGLAVLAGAAVARRRRTRTTG